MGWLESRSGKAPGNEYPHRTRDRRRDTVPPRGERALLSQRRPWHTADGYYGMCKFMTLLHEVTEVLAVKPSDVAMMAGGNHMSQIAEMLRSRPRRGRLRSFWGCIGSSAAAAAAASFRPRTWLLR